MCVRRGLDFTMAPSTTRSKITNALDDEGPLLKLVTLHVVQPGSENRRRDSMQLLLSKNPVKLWMLLVERHWNPVRLWIML